MVIVGSAVAIGRASFTALTPPPTPPHTYSMQQRLVRVQSPREVLDPVHGLCRELLQLTLHTLHRGSGGTGVTPGPGAAAAPTSLLTHMRQGEG